MDEDCADKLLQAETQEQICREAGIGVPAQGNVSCLALAY